MSRHPFLARRDSARDPVESFYTNLGYAEVLYDRLCRQFWDFETSLGDEEELGGYFASFGKEVLLRITNVGYHNPYFMVFYGECVTSGERVQLVQHVNQVSILLKAVPKPSSVSEPRRIGFGIRSGATTQPEPS
jgi:hypothetical protein